MGRKVESILTRFEKVWEEIKTISLDPTEPLTLVLFGLSVVVTLLAVYLGYLYTKTLQLRRERLALVEKLRQQTAQAAEESGDREDADGLEAESPPTWPSEGDATATIQEITKDSQSEKDPVEYCSHIPAEVKRTQQRVALEKIESDMSADQREKERDIQRQQLAAIFNLMEDQKDKFGVKNMEDMQSQMKLYTQ